MRYLSLFSGIEAATVAWHPLGWVPAAFSEIEPFPCAVLAHHYPEVPNLGDVTKITEEQVRALGQLDLVVFGSPCQDLSVAGKRAGLQGERSGLFFTAARIVEWARTHCGCRFALWENVPGAFSSNQGRDFAVVVGELAGVEDVAVPPKGWGNEGAIVGDKGLVEWSTLDAQWFGVAQRRRRVFALADFGDWTRRPPVLLECESLRGDSAPRREAGQGTSRGVEVGPAGGRFVDVNPTLDARAKDGFIRNQLGGVLDGDGSGVAGTLSAEHDRNRGLGNANESDLIVAQEAPPRCPVSQRRRDGANRLRDGDIRDGVAHCLETTCNDYSRADGFNMIVEETTHTLRADGFDASEDGTGRGTPLVTVKEPVTFDTTQITSPANRSNPKPGDPCHTLAKGAAPPLITFGHQEGQRFAHSEVATNPLTANQTQAVAFSAKDHGADASDEVAPTLRAGGADKSHANSGNWMAVAFHETGATLKGATLKGGSGERGHPDPSDGNGHNIVGVTTAFKIGQGAKAHGMGLEEECAPTLGAADSGTQRAPGILKAMQVRRLTPRECERLQGFPDDYTLIPYRNKQAADGPRYKALGNSMARPVMRWIGEQLDLAVWLEGKL